MRVFLSAFSGFTLAVPMNAVAAMMLYEKKTEKIIQYDQKDRSTYISLPRLFNLNEEDVRHGIILREWNTTANKVVLLTAEIKRDIEIPDNEFHPIPKSLGALRFSKIFNGIKFSDNPVLLLNIEQLTQYIQEEQQSLNEKNNFMEPPLSEEPLAKEPPPIVSEPPPPPPEAESQVEQPPSEEPPQERPLLAVVSEVEPLTDLLVLSDLPPEEPPPAVVSEEEPLTDLMVLEEPLEDLQVLEEPLEDLQILEEPSPEELSSAVVSEIEPLTDLLVLSEETIADYNS